MFNAVDHTRHKWYSTRTSAPWRSSRAPALHPHNKTLLYDNAHRIGTICRKGRSKHGGGPEQRISRFALPLPPVRARVRVCAIQLQSERCRCRLALFVDSAYLRMPSGSGRRNYLLPQMPLDGQKSRFFGY